MDSALTGSPIFSFEEFISPLNSGDFLRDYLGKKPIRIEGDKDRFSSLLTLDSLNRLLGCRHATPFFRVVRDNADIPTQRFLKPQKSWLASVSMVDVGALNAELTKGATVVLNSLEQLHDPVSSICRMLEAELGNCIDVVAFASFGTTTAFHTHWDHEQVFIVQVMGKKRWRLFPHVRPNPTVSDQGKFPIPSEEPYWEGDLAAGSILYVPSGWWHDVTVAEGPSVHISFGSDMPTGLDLAQALVSRLSNDESIRAILPRYAEDAVRTQYLTDFRRSVQTAIEDLSLEDFFRERDSMAPARGRMSLPWSAIANSIDPWRASDRNDLRACPLPQSGWVHWLLPRAVPFTKSEGTVSFNGTGYQFIFDDVAEPLLTQLMRQRRVRMEQIVSAYASEYLESLLFRLVSWGLIALTPEPFI